MMTTQTHDHSVHERHVATYKHHAENAPTGSVVKFPEQFKCTLILNTAQLNSARDSTISSRKHLNVPETYGNIMNRNRERKS